jgi:HEAT repeat protein
MGSLGQQDLALSLQILKNCLHNDPEMDVKAAAADAIGALGLRDAYDDLLTLYQSNTDWVLRLSVIATLGELGEPRAYDLLVEALDSPEDLLKLAAVGALGDLGDHRAVPLLAPFIQTPDWQVRQRAAQSLYRLYCLGAEAAQPLLATLAQDTSQQVVDAATGVGLG